MEAVIPPVETELLLAELTKDKFLRKSNFGNTELYVFNCKDSPNLTKELGRLREITFRMAGGGTGKSYDIDQYDLGEDPYLQLIVWDPEEKQIIGGYRFILGDTVLDNPEEKLATSHLFDFSENFLENYLPYSIELGRSFVQPGYQYGRNARKGMFALDNLWDGLGALTVEYPEMKYLFGKITMYKHFDISARDHILSFLGLYFPDTEKLLTPKDPIAFKKAENVFAGNDYQNDYKILNAKVRETGEKIPPLVNAYMNLSPSMITFGTVENDEFGGVEETGILINIADIYASKSDRHIKTYKRGIKLSQIFPRNIKIFNPKQWRLSKKQNKSIK
ncbi:MAG TPA: GNAT family N-acyltransferase [Bacteroidales bacterium]|nr:GNAT family N-acyltransferase [Bacteroidales bacterium]HPL05139.1 GNAT family N-acyltransferase [Bacteroidales bacterium]HPX75799.1 GNAT family N-acyltransferase [Bacteroidales bacterium]HQB22049.1 GNAT family N-acyltransferase [Bacteroidales bacterium]